MPVLIDIANTEQGTYRWVKDNGQIASEYNYSVETNRWYESWSGHSDRKFRAMKSRGELIPYRPYTRISYRRQLVKSTCTIAHPRDGGGDGIYTGPVEFRGVRHPAAGDLIGLFAESPELDYVVQRAAAKYYTDAWDALTFTAELQSTIKMFTVLAQKALKLAKGIKPQDRRLKRLADINLEYRYGWRSLYFDLLDIQEVLTKSRSKHFKATTEMSGSQVHTPVGYTGNTWSSGTWSYSFQDPVVHASFRGSCFGLSAPPRISLNPILTAWELVKLSFVIDWIMNVGQALAALSFVALNDKHTAAASLRLTADFTQQAQIIQSTEQAARWPLSQEEEWRYVLDYRMRNPREIPKRPMLKIRLDGWKIVDLLSLLKQRLKH